MESRVTNGRSATYRGPTASAGAPQFYPVLSETLTKGLGRYAIGEKLRALRLKKKIGLVELGRHTGLSAAMLSKVERGKLYPTFPTLLRIALVFSVGLEYFFSDDQKRRALAIVRERSASAFPSVRMGAIFLSTSNLSTSLLWSEN